MNEFISWDSGTLTIGDIHLTFTVSAVVEILIFAVLCYLIIIWIKKTKAWSLLKGIAILVVFYAVCKLAQLNDLTYLFEKLFSSIIVAVIIIFQPEIRRALEQIGKKNIFKSFGAGVKTLNTASGLSDQSVGEIVRAMGSLGRNKVGALIVIEKEVLLDEYIETGIVLDAKITSQLLEQIFEHNTPLHDGAVILRQDRIVAATCYLPLSQNPGVSKELGTRHRAGLGISEATDAITLIASEETGNLSVAIGGALSRRVSTDYIRELLVGNPENEEKEASSAIVKILKGRQKNERKN